MNDYMFPLDAFLIIEQKSTWLMIITSFSLAGHAQSSIKSFYDYGQLHVSVVRRAQSVSIPNWVHSHFIRRPHLIMGLIMMTLHDCPNFWVPHGFLRT